MALTLADLLLAPPPGTYDPSLDAELAAAQRGLSDLESDTALGSTRALTDYGIGRQGLETGRSRGLADIAARSSFETQDYERGAGRAREDALRAGVRSAENYQRSSEGLRRQYEQMATGQAERQRSLGDVSAGTAAQSARKRAANQAYTQFDLTRGQERSAQDIDLGYQRQAENLDTGHARAQYGSSTAAGRLGEDTDTGLANLALRYGRGEEDRQSQVTRARREGQFFEQDVSANKFWQALQSGLWPA